MKRFFCKKAAALVALFLFAATPAFAQTTNLCERTPKVRDAILARIPGRPDCGTVTAEQLAGITILGIGGQNLTSLKAIDFEGLTALWYLEVSHNHLTVLPDLSHLAALRYLNVSSNQLTTLPDLSRLAALERLAVSYNQLITLPDLSRLAALDQLNANNNRLTSLTDLSRLVALEHLNVSSNQLTTLPDLSRLAALEHLNVSNNQLTTLPDLSRLVALKHLNVNVNRLTSLPDLSRLVALEILVVVQNQLTSLPDLSRLAALEHLNVSNNQLTTLPDMSRLVALRYLNVNVNRLTSLPDLSSLNALRTLYVAFNQLSNLRNLTLTDENNKPIALTPKFAGNITAYTASTTAASVKVSPTAADTGILPSFLGDLARPPSIKAGLQFWERLMPVVSGTATASIAMSAGTNTIKVTVDGRSGPKTYSIVIRMPGLVVSTPILTVAEGGTAEYTVVLSSRPTGAVTVTPTISAADNATMSPETLTFTTSNWYAPQTVTVMGVNDDINNAADRTATITHSTSGGGYNLGGVTPVMVTVTDDDMAGIMVSPNVLSVTENGGIAEYTVALTSEPTGTVTVTLTNSDATNVTVSPETLIFTASNWDMAQDVRVTGIDDSIVNASDRTATITHTVSGGGYGSVTADSVAVTLTDDDTANIAVSPAALSVAENGGMATYTVVLTSEPTGTVTVTLTSSDATNATVSPETLTFTTSNWNMAQDVTVTGVDDDIVNTPVRTATITHTVSGGGYGSVTTDSVAVTLTDDDTADIAVSPTALSVAENSGMATYTVALTSEPTGTVTVTPTSSDATNATVSPETLTFTALNWSMPQDVTVSGIDDFIANASDRTATIIHTVSGGDYGSVTADSLAVTLTDDDTADIAVSPTALSVAENSGMVIYTVALTSEPTGTVTVTPTSSDATDVTVSPETLTFTASNWNMAQDVTVTGIDDSIVNTPVRTATITHAASGYGGVTSADSVSVTVTDNDTAGITVNPPALSVAESGGTETYTVVLNTQPTGDVTVKPSSSDTTVVAVSDSLVFTMENWETAQIVTVTGVNDDIDNAADRTATITHVAAGGGYGNVSANDVTVLLTDDDVADVTVSETALSVSENGGTVIYTVVLTSEPTGNVAVVPMSSDDTVATVSDALIFTPSDWDIPQNVTVTGIDDNIANTLARTATISHTVAGYGSVTAAASVMVTVTDDDITLTAVSDAAGEAIAEGESVVFTVTPGAAPDSPVTLTWAVTLTDPIAAADFIAVAGTLTIADTTAQTFAIVTADDSEVEDNEIFTVTFGVRGGAPGWLILPADIAITITDNDMANDRTGAVDTNAGGDITLDDGTSISIPAAAFPESEAADRVTFRIQNVADLTTLPEQPARMTILAAFDIDAIIDGSEVEYAFEQPVTLTFPVSEEDLSAVGNDPGRLVVLRHNGAEWETLTTTYSAGPPMTLAATTLHFSDFAVGYTDPAPTDPGPTNPTPTNPGPTNPAPTNPGGGAPPPPPPARTLAVSETSITVAEGASATWTVALGTQPTGDVTVTPTSNDEAVATVSPETLAFTTSDWNTPQTVTVTGVNDGVVNADARATTIGHAASGGGYNLNLANRISVTVTDYVSSVSVESDELPLEVELSQNYPNPFNPQTTIEYALPQAGDVRLIVYDMLGHEVAVLYDGPQPAGRHAARFDANRLPNGAYAYRLAAGGKAITRTMVLLK